MDWFGALVTAGTVVLGVTLARWLEHRGVLWQQIRGDTIELSAVMTYVSAGYIASDGSMDTSLNSEWWKRRDRVFFLVARIRACAAALRPRGKDVVDALDEFVVLLGAAEQRFMFEGRHLPKFAALDVRPEKLRRAVLPGDAPDSPQPRIDRVLAMWDRMQGAAEGAAEEE